MKTIKKYKDNRLVFYREKADPSYWDSTWDHQDTSSIYAAAKRGSLGYFDELFEKFLPKQGTIIEAGCGLGQLVIALISRGYRVEGVDNAQKTIHSLQQQFPSIPFRVEDVKSLKVADSTYSAYISIGVVEHDEHGPSLFLEEAFRILKKDGIALISVPYINPLRRIKALLGSYYRGPTDLPFYQYAFSKTEFKIGRAHV